MGEGHVGVKMSCYLSINFMGNINIFYKKIKKKKMSQETELLLQLSTAINK